MSIFYFSEHDRPLHLEIFFPIISNNGSVSHQFHPITYTIIISLFNYITRKSCYFTNKTKTYLNAYNIMVVNETVDLQTTFFYVRNHNFENVQHFQQILERSCTFFSSCNIQSIHYTPYQSSKYHSFFYLFQPVLLPTSRT